MPASRLLRLALAASLVPACGDSSSDTRASGDTMVTTATTPPVSSTAVATEPPATGTSDDPATSEPTAGPGPTSVTTTDEPVTTGGPGSDPATGPDPGATTEIHGTSTGEPPATGEYAAMFFPGDPSRISVRKADADNDVCVAINFVVSPEGGPLEYEVTLPATWQVQGALASKGAAGCLTFEGFADEPQMALSGNGSATWAGACPATLDIDVLIALPEGLPAEELMQATGVAVSGC